MANSQASVRHAETKPHLDEVCSSATFAKSQRSTALLRYLWQVTHDGRAGEVKEYGVGVDVLGRGADYDPKIDSIVRTEVTRLRARLVKYYESEGAASSIRFEIPKGAYFLNFAEIETEVPASEPANPVGTPPPASSFQLPRVSTFLAVAAVVAATAAAGWMMLRPEPTARSMRFELRPPPGVEFDPASFAVSPDGQTLAFAGIQNGKRGLWVRALDGRAPRLLPGTNGASQPFWSPDSRNIAYYGEGKMRRVDAATGGNPAVICDQFESLGSFWGDDGVIVFSPVAGGLKTVPASGGVPVPLTTLDASRSEISHRWPQPLPDKRVLFFAASSNAANGSVDVVERSDPKRRIRIMPTVDGALYSAGRLVWRRGASLVAQSFDPRALKLSGESRPIADVSAPEAPTRIMLSASDKNAVLIVGTVPFPHQLAWVDRRGDRVAAFGAPNRHSMLALTRDAKRAVVAVGSPVGAFDLWAVDLERDGWSRLTFSQGGSNNFPIWSPDGRVVVYRSGRPPNLYGRDAQGAGGSFRLSESKNTQWPTSWSADGRTIMYYEQAQGANRDIWTVAVGADGRASAQPTVYLNAAHNEHWGKFMPVADPRWVAYESDESGRPEVYLRSYPSPNRKFAVSGGRGGGHPEWNGDGTEIFFVSDSRLMSAEVKAGEGGTVTVTTPKALFMLPDTGGYFAPAPDGKRFLVNSQVSPVAPLDVIVNWTAKIR